MGVARSKRAQSKGLSKAKLKCSWKKKHPSRRGAEAAIQRLLIRFPDSPPLYPYKCNQCRFWHITKVPGSEVRHPEVQVRHQSPGDPRPRAPAPVHKWAHILDSGAAYPRAAGIAADEDQEAFDEAWADDKPKAAKLPPRKRP